MLPLLVTAAIIERDGKFLATRRRPDSPYPGLWEFPGGKLEADEDPQCCVVRELKEELDIDIEVEAIYDVIYHRYPERPVLVLAYRCKWLSGTIRNLQVAEHSWVSPSEFVGLQLLPADIPIFARLGSEHVTANTPAI